MGIGIGIAIEPTVVRAVRVERSRDQVSLLSAEEQAFDPSQAEALTRALASLRQNLNIRQPVYLGLPSASALVTTLHPLVVNQPRAQLAVEFELQQQLPYKISDAAWHYQWVLAINGRAEVLPKPPRQAALSARRFPEVSAMVAAVKQEVLLAHLTACRRAGLAVSGVSVAPIALLNACAAQRSATRAKTMTVLYLQDPISAQWILWSADDVRVIPAGASSPEALPQEIAASWQSIQAQWPEAATTAWVVAPDSAFAGISGALSESGAQVQRFDPVQALGMRSIRPELAHRCAAAIGLALQAVSASRVCVNILSHAQRSLSMQWLRRASIGVSLVCALLILVLGANGMMSVQNQKAQLLKSFETREKRYQQLRPEVRNYLKRQQRLMQLSRQLQALLGASAAVPETLARAAEALPETVWLTKCELTQNSGVDILLEGRASSFQEVTQLMDGLKALKGVTGVKPLSSSVVPGSSTGKEIVNFSIQAQRSPEG